MHDGLADLLLTHFQSAGGHVLALEDAFEARAVERLGGIGAVADGADGGEQALAVLLFGSEFVLGSGGLVRTTGETGAQKKDRNESGQQDRYGAPQPTIIVGR